MMQTTAHQDNLHKIVILNPKGGCGKTTLATNLASYFARRGPPPTLVDRDPGGYSMRWIEKRPTERPRIYGIAEYSDAHYDKPLGAWPGSKELIVDLPAATDKERFFHEIYDAGSVLIPVMPSEIDIHSAASFIADLLLLARFDRRNRNIAIVANRTRHYMRSYRMLMRFLRSLEIPIVAELRDSQNYVFAAANGIGICEMPAYRVGKDMESFEALVDWLDRWRLRRFDAMVTDEYGPMRSSDIVEAALIKSSA
jgi:chromosome partitioning protein